VQQPVAGISAFLHIGCHCPNLMREIDRIDTALDRTRAHGLMAKARRAQRQDLATAGKPSACQSRQSIVCWQSFV
jgi:hypothetical protein